VVAVVHIRQQQTEQMVLIQFFLPLHQLAVVEVENIIPVE
jgi:hypothetical protein